MTLIETVQEQVKQLPEEKIQEVLDFVGYLQFKEEQTKSPSGERTSHMTKDREELKRLLEAFQKLPDLDNRTPDEILGYDENGLP